MFFAGRLQLLQCVLYSIQVYCTGLFSLPKRVIKLIGHKFNNFLSAGSDDKATVVKVSWDLVRVPKQESSLGLRKVEEWNNKAAVMRHIWNLFAQHALSWLHG
jgi:hypothetical protein